MQGQFNQGFRNQDVYGYGLNRMAPNSPGFGQLLVEKKPSIEDLFGTFITKIRNGFVKNESWLDEIEIQMTSIESSVKNLDTQIG